MPRTTAKAVKTTLYRLPDLDNLEDGLSPDVFKKSAIYSRVSIKIEGRDALLVSGSISADSKWAVDVNRLTGENLRFRSTSPRAALIIRGVEAKSAWALTWGLGYQMLNTEKLDYTFGPGIIARSAVSSDIKSVTKTVLDHRSRTDRSTLPVGSNIQDFGLDGFGEVVTRIESKARIRGLTVGDGIIHLSAADSLKVPLAKSPPDLIKDLRALDLLRTEPVVRGLESIEQLVALKPQDPLIQRLEATLLDGLRGGGGPIAISWPHEQLEVLAPALSCKVTGFGDHRPRVFPDPPDITEVLGWFSNLSRDDAAQRLSNVRLQLHGEADPSAGSAVSTQVPLRRWLAVEVVKGPRRFCFHNGKWYRMDDNYLARIDDRVRDILSLPSPVALPAWPSGEHEEDYNKRAAALIGATPLDRKFISTPLHRRGIEPCDIYAHPGNLVCIKRGDKSASLSHLLAQGLVSGDALARDESARDAWRQRVESESGGTIPDADVQTIVLAIGQPAPVTVESLFTFTKVNLVKQYDALRYIGVGVSVLSIPEA